MGADGQSSWAHEWGSHVERFGLVQQQGFPPGMGEEGATEVQVVIRKQTISVGDFPGGPVVKAPRFQCRGRRFDPWSGNESRHATQQGREKKRVSHPGSNLA